MDMSKVVSIDTLKQSHKCSVYGYVKTCFHRLSQSVSQVFILVYKFKYTNPKTGPNSNKSTEILSFPSIKHKKTKVKRKIEHRYLVT